MAAEGSGGKWQLKMSLETIIQRISGSDRRSALLLKNVLASFAVKGWSVVVQLLLVPLTLSCLGTYENGVWLTVSSVLLWVDNLDVGLGNGLRNKLATCMAEGKTEHARTMVSSTVAMLTVIIVPVAVLLVVFELTGDVYGLFNVSVSKVDNLVSVLVLSTVLVCMTFILKFLGNFYMGLQLPAVSNAIVTGGNTLALSGTFLVWLSGCHSLLLVALANTAGPLLAYLICLPVTFCGRFRYLRPSFRLVSWNAVRELFVIGGKFFVLQIAGIVLFFSTNILISRFFSPDMVTPYQIANRYFMVAMLLFTILCVPYWSATTDAYAKHDFTWIRRANRTLNRFMVFIFLLIVGMICVSPFIYHIWIGDKAAVPFSMTVLVGMYQFILIYSTRYSFVLNGIGVLRLQLYVTIVMAVVYIPMAMMAVRHCPDIHTLLVLMCAVNVPGLILNAVQYRKVIGGHAHGIWGK